MSEEHGGDDGPWAPVISLPEIMALQDSPEDSSTASDETGSNTEGNEKPLDFRYNDVGENWRICDEDFTGHKLVWEFHHSAVHYGMHYRSFNKMVIEQVSKNAEVEAGQIVSAAAVTAKLEMQDALKRDMEIFETENPHIPEMVEKTVHELLDNARLNLAEREARIVEFPIDTTAAQMMLRLLPELFWQLMDKMSIDICSAESEHIQLLGLQGMEHKWNECSKVHSLIENQLGRMQALWGEAITCGE